MAGHDWLDVDSARWPTVESNYATATGHACQECATTFTASACPTCGEQPDARGFVIDHDPTPAGFEATVVANGGGLVADLPVEAWR